MSELINETIDWLWLMDDDTITTPSALAALLDSCRRSPAEHKPRVLASRVNWTDGSVHYMYMPIVNATSSRRSAH